jgi:hypothetical protein
MLIMDKVYKKYYKVTIGDNVTVRELKSDLPFSVEEGKGNIKYNHPKAIEIKHISYKEVKRLQQLDENAKDKL